MAAGYWNGGEDSSAFVARTAANRGPFLRSGDLGFLQEGRLFVTGRIKDVLIVDGVKHSPCDLEITSAESHRELRRFAGAAFAEDEGEGGAAIVLLQEVDRRLPAARHAEIIGGIRRAISENHGIQARTVRLLIAGTLPRTSSGKIIRNEARARYLRGQFRFSDVETGISCEPALAGVKE